MYYTIVGYHPVTDEETKEDAVSKPSILAKARQFEAQGLVDIEIFHNSDDFEETKSYEFKDGKLIA